MSSEAARACRVAFAVVALLMSLAVAKVAWAHPVTVNPGDYGGQWAVSGSGGYVSGVQTVNLPTGPAASRRRTGTNSAPHTPSKKTPSGLGPISAATERRGQPSGRGSRPWTPGPPMATSPTSTNVGTGVAVVASRTGSSMGGDEAPPQAATETRIACGMSRSIGRRLGFPHCVSPTGGCMFAAEVERTCE